MDWSSDVCSSDLGKTVKLEDKSYTHICAIRNGGEYTCSIFVKSGGRGIVSKAKQWIRFEADGEDAKLLHSMFHADPATGRVSYQTSDAYFHVESDGHRFVAEYRIGN